MLESYLKRNYFELLPVKLHFALIFFEYSPDTVQWAAATPPLAIRSFSMDNFMTKLMYLKSCSHASCSSSVHFSSSEGRIALMNCGPIN